MVSICLKARCKYKKQALFLSCFGVYTVSVTFCLVFSGHFAGFWVLFLGFLQFQLLFAWSFPDILLGFGCCFWDFCSFSYFFSDFPRLLGWIWVLFLGFLQFQLLFFGFSQAFGLDLGAVFEVLEITAPQVLPTMLSTYGY